MLPARRVEEGIWTPEKLEKIGIIKSCGYYDFHATKKWYLDWLCGKIPGKKAPLGLPRKFGKEFYAGPVNVSVRKYCKGFDVELGECAAGTDNEKTMCVKKNFYCGRFDFTINPEVWENPSGRAYK